MFALTKRNLLLYFRNHTGVFFSLLGAMISFVLYVIFLKKTMISSWQQVPNSRQLLDFWLIGGTLSVTAITTTLSSLGQLVRDKERGVIKDFYLTDISRFKMKVSYMLSAAIIGFLMQLIMLAIMLGYFAATDNLVIPWSKTPAVLGLAFLSALLSVVIDMLFVQFISRFDSLGTIESILGAASGFLVGTYIPIGGLPHFAQLLIKFTPGSYVAALYRQIFMNDPLTNAFHGQQGHFEKIMGVKIAWTHLLTGNQTIELLIAAFIIGMLILLLTELIRSQKRNKVTDFE
ncbi:ABC transporter permease [Lentilactobacillus diolivorans]|uniref:ABC transporter permease n=1 Tax=Lentilactobacillus diolivorans TaxID=179838 RepID=UPI002468FAEE|nr:ABC transporter permease [Lentilactobacillus diolivorans]MDH5105797.1 ABC transporter permease [Lentilactobacillus diolivorans]